jgi:GDP-mannose 6-dehydrogenase
MKQPPFRITVFGLGYVGCVSAVCLAHLGNQVIGVDVDQQKVDLIRQAKPTIVEKEVAQLLQCQHRGGSLTATQDVAHAIQHADLSIICVGTPANQTGGPDLSAIWEVAQQIGRALQVKEKFHTIAMRSTVPPGTCQQFEEMVASQSGKQVDQAFSVVSNPEFLREGSSVQDYFHPPFSLIGTNHKQAAAILRQLYQKVNAPIIETDRKIAEMIKYVNNAFHALKVTFANEVGAICKAFGIDSHVLMDLFCQDDQLNLSSAYLKPGFAFGGSCLPKDLSALDAISRQQKIEVPVLSTISHSNSQHIARIVDVIRKAGKKRIGFLGLSFKAGTDDLRGSPVMEILRQLDEKGYELLVYDTHVTASSAVHVHAPHLARYMVLSLAAVRQRADVIVVTQKIPEYQGFVKEILSEKEVIDLVRLFADPPQSANYSGLLW